MNPQSHNSTLRNYYSSPHTPKKTCDHWCQWIGPYSHYSFLDYNNVILTGAWQCQWQQLWLRKVQYDGVVRGVRLSWRPVVPSSVTGRSVAAAVIYRGAPAAGAITAAAVAAIRPRTGQHDGSDTWIYFFPCRPVKSVRSVDGWSDWSRIGVGDDGPNDIKLLLRLFFLFS